MDNGNRRCSQTIAPHLPRRAILPCLCCVAQETAHVPGDVARAEAALAALGSSGRLDVRPELRRAILRRIRNGARDAHPGPSGRPWRDVAPMPISIPMSPKTAKTLTLVLALALAVVATESASARTKKRVH